jgi:outer membrane receptor protein involved in Fe transport
MSTEATRCAGGDFSRRSTRRTALPAALVACAALLADPVPAGAQAIATSDSVPTSGAPAMRGVADTVTVLPPVQVVGSRGLVPDRVTATRVRLDRAKLMSFLPNNAADALVAVPGVDLIKTGPWASLISMRGLSGDRVLVMVDGVRVNGVRGHGAQSSLIPVDQLDGVELLPGAGSAQFGSDALGGVINLVTHRSLFGPQPAASLTLAASGGDPGAMWSESGRGAFLSPWLGVEVAAGGGGLGELVIPTFHVPNSGFRNRFTTLRLATRAAGAVLDAEHSHQAASDVGLPAFNSSAGATGRYPLQARDADRLELTLPGGRTRPEARLLAVAQTLRTDFTETSVDSNYLRGRFVATRATVVADGARTRIASLQPALRFPGLSGLRLSGEYRQETTGGPRVTEQTVKNAAGAVTGVRWTAGESMPAARRDVWSAALFAPLTSRRVRIEPGLRFDAIRSRSDPVGGGSLTRLDVRDRRWSGELGLARPFGALEPYVHLATGFRVPNLEERYYNSDIHGGLRLFGNPDLVAERSASYEAGLRASALGLLSEGRISAFRSDVRDLITFRYVGQLYLVPRFQYLNVNRARIEGVEASLQLHLSTVALDIAAALPRAVDAATGARLADAGSARVTADAAVPMAGLPYGRLTLRARWNDAVHRVGPTLARPAFVVFAVEAASVIAGVRIVIAVRNLSNASYREPLSFIPEPGRTFALSLRREFTVPFRHGSP